jgi:hypothetical protein
MASCDNAHWRRRVLSPRTLDTTFTIGETDIDIAGITTGKLPLIERHTGESCSLCLNYAERRFTVNNSSNICIPFRMSMPQVEETDRGAKRASRDTVVLL